MQALRPLSMSATIDLLLSDPQWSAHLDAAKIGGFGASQGGETLLLMAGAGLTKSIGLSWSQVANDSRLKAAVGYVPYFGQVLFPAFGRDQHGLDGVALPYLGISGTADTTAPLVQTIQGMNHLAGPRELVTLKRAYGRVPDPHHNPNCSEREAWRPVCDSLLSLPAEATRPSATRPHPAACADTGSSRIFGAVPPPPPKARMCSSPANRGPCHPISSTP